MVGATTPQGRKLNEWSFRSPLSRISMAKGALGAPEFLGVPLGGLLKKCLDEGACGAWNGGARGTQYRVSSLGSVLENDPCGSWSDRQAKLGMNELPQGMSPLRAPWGSSLKVSPEPPCPPPAGGR